MKIILIGYGKMGKAIEKFAVERGHTIAARIDAGDSLNEQVLTNAEVAIEFTQADSVVNNLKVCFDAGLPVVCGTTGWLEKKNEVDSICREKNGTFFYASNFSLGVNIFFKLNKYLAEVMNNYPAYGLEIDEIHHTQKKDAPSGTAISLANDILDKVKRKGRWVNTKISDPDALVINSYREDPAPGTHAVRYFNAVDSIEIKHTAHSRDGFALGAITVAEWLKDKKGVLGMGDFLKL